MTEWNPDTVIALIGLAVTLISSVVVITIAIRNFKEELVKTTLAYERKLTQMESGLRAAMTEMGFFVRDYYVHNDVFDKMIDMAAANNENQFRALTSSIDRIGERLDIIQAEIHRAQP